MRIVTAKIVIALRMVLASAETNASVDEIAPRLLDVCGLPAILYSKNGNMTKI